jgi:Protein trafficking PGA2
MDNAADRAMEVLQFIPMQLGQWYHNFTHNIVHMWDGMTAIKYIRMIAVVGAYILLRPYIAKFGERFQEKQHEKELDPYEMGEQKAKLSPNALRGVGGRAVELEESEEEEEEEAEGTAADVKWGKKARKRQRMSIKKLLEEKERLLQEQQEDDDDKDIAKYLVDYKEGEDGW